MNRRHLCNQLITKQWWEIQNSKITNLIFNFRLSCAVVFFGFNKHMALRFRRVAEASRKFTPFHPFLLGDHVLPRSSMLLQVSSSKSSWRARPTAFLPFLPSHLKITQRASLTPSRSIADVAKTCSLVKISFLVDTALSILDLRRVRVHQAHGA